MIRTYRETVSKIQSLTKKNNNTSTTTTIIIIVKENTPSPVPPPKKKWGKVGGKMAICICVRKKEKPVISTSTRNCEQVKYCPTTYNGIWPQGQNSKADKLLMTAHF